MVVVGKVDMRVICLSTRCDKERIARIAGHVPRARGSGPTQHDRQPSIVASRMQGRRQEGVCRKRLHGIRWFHRYSRPGKKGEHELWCSDLESAGEEGGEEKKTYSNGTSTANTHCSVKQKKTANLQRERLLAALDDVVDVGASCCSVAEKTCGDCPVVIPFTSTTVLQLPASSTPGTSAFLPPPSHEAVAHVPKHHACSARTPYTPPCSLSTPGHRAAAQPP